MHRHAIGGRVWQIGGFQASTYVSSLFSCLRLLRPTDVCLTSFRWISNSKLCFVYFFSRWPLEERRWNRLSMTMLVHRSMNLNWTTIPFNQNKRRPTPFFHRLVLHPWSVSLFYHAPTYRASCLACFLSFALNRSSMSLIPGLTIDRQRTWQRMGSIIFSTGSMN